MWLPWHKPAAVFVGGRRLLVEGLGDTPEDIQTEQPVAELSRLIDRLRGYRASVFIGAALVRLTTVPRVAKVRKPTERAKAASALAELPLSEWHLTVVNPSASSVWLVYAMQRRVLEELQTLRLKHEGRIRSIKPYSGVVFESLLAHRGEAGMIGVHEKDSDQLSWIITSDREVKSAGQVRGIGADLLASETTRLCLANGVSPVHVQMLSFDPRFQVQAETSALNTAKPVAFGQLLLPVSIA